MPSDQFGLGSGTPSRFPYPDRPQPGSGVAPGAGTVIRARVVIVFGPAGTINGVFVYAPGTTPRLGNPPIAAITASATDPYGNSVQPGAASSLGTIITFGSTPAGGTPSFVQLVPGSPARMLVGTGDADESQAAGVVSDITGAGTSRQLIAIMENAFVTGAGPAHLAQVQLYSASPDVTQLAQVVLIANSNVSSCQVTVSPSGTTVTGPFTSVTGAPANPSLVTTDTWQGLGSPGIANTTVNTSQYARMPFGVGTSPMTCIDVAITVNAGGAAAGVYTFASTLAAAYRFPGNYSRSYPVGFNGTITTATNNSDMIIDGAGTANPGRVRLQIPALPVNTEITATLFIPLG